MKILNLRQLTFLLIAFASVIAVAQSKPTVSLSIAMEKHAISSGQKPWVDLTVKNLTDKEISYPTDQVFVQGENGEPPATPWQKERRLGHLGSGYTPTIQPGESFTMKYDLSAFYDLSKPGKYSVYIEVYVEEGALRSPVASFEVQAPQR